MFLDLHPDPVRHFLDTLLTLMAGEQWYTNAQGTGLFPRRRTVSLLWECVGQGKISFENGLCHTPGHAGHAEKLGFYNEHFFWTWDNVVLSSLSFYIVIIFLLIIESSFGVLQELSISHAPEVS